MVKINPKREQQKRGREVIYWLIELRARSEVGERRRKVISRKRLVEVVAEFYMEKRRREVGTLYGLVETNTKCDRGKIRREVFNGFIK